MAYTEGLGQDSLLGGFLDTTTYTYESSEGIIGNKAISLADMLQAPDLALMQVVTNVRNNAWQYAIGATIFGIGAKVTRKLLKSPINTVNRIVFTGKDAPLRGLGVRI